MAVFECHSHSEKHCFCATIELHPATLEYLQKTEYDCLCNKCLDELNRMVIKLSEKPFDPKIFNAPEGEYYYRENGLVVLTELYHIAKGHCCQSGCRHCAYGFNLIH